MNLIILDTPYTCHQPENVGVRATLRLSDLNLHVFSSDSLHILQHYIFFTNVTIHMYTLRHTMWIHSM